MISLRSFISKSLPNRRRFYGGARTLVTQKLQELRPLQDDKTAVVAIDASFLPDRAGLLPMAKIPQITEVVNRAINKSSLLQISETDAKKREVITVVKAQQVKIFPEFYNNMKANSRLFIHCSIRDIGTTSFSEQFYIYDKTNSKLLCKNTRTLVICDLEMKPVPLPEPFLGLISSIVTHKERYVCPRPFTQRPGNVFTTYVVPRPSDCDTYYHVNHSNYMTFMLDAAVSAAKAGAYKALKQDIAFGTIDEIIFYYYKELASNDNVMVETWQDENHPLKICFQMSTRSQLAFQGSILLQEPLLELSDELKRKLPRAKQF